jgi:hypothetical protein
MAAGAGNRVGMLAPEQAGATGDHRDAAGEVEPIERGHRHESQTA